MSDAMLTLARLNRFGATSELTLTLMALAHKSSHNRTLCRNS